MTRAFASLVLLLAMQTSLAACHEPSTRAASDSPPLPEVRVATAEQRDVPNRFDFVGTIEPISRVELRARVRGYITRIGFTEGTVVEADQVLFEIDTRPFRAEKRAAAAAVRRTKAQLTEAKRQLAREQQLRGVQVSAAEDLDSAQASVDALTAEVGAQRAALEQAELDLGFSRVRAPFRGRVGERLVDVGELVGEGTATLLAVLVEEDPVFVRFSPAERERRQMLALVPELESPTEVSGVPVELRLSDGSNYPHPGRLAFVDNALDPTTRSLTYKASVANSDRHLKPGESVTASVVLRSSRRLLVPAVAVASMQSVDYVYVVDDNGTAHYREVTLGTTIGGDRIVSAGLERGEHVIVEGVQRVSDGAAIRVIGDRAATAARTNDAPVEPG